MGNAPHGVPRVRRRLSSAPVASARGCAPAAMQRVLHHGGANVGQLALHTQSAKRLGGTRANRGVIQGEAPTSFSSSSRTSLEAVSEEST
jgi:hypothetical protein